MILHVLPGDAYIDSFVGTGLEGETAIFREALIEGDLWGPSLPEFWKTRENYHSKDQREDLPSYQNHVAAEIEKLLKPGAGDEIHLWFEYELFCNVNYWFCLYLLRDSFATIYRVAPTVLTEDDRWQGFGQLESDELLKCWKQKTKLTTEDIELGSDLWQAFKTGNDYRLKKLSKTGSNAFPYLNEVAGAAAEIGEKPKELVRSLFSKVGENFSELFSEFRQQAGVYGFGNSQVKRLLDEVKSGN
jgi:hypothetical protein